MKEGYATTCKFRRFNNFDKCQGLLTFIENPKEAQKVRGIIKNLIETALDKWK